jgi:2,4-dienoyl-CoA reductase-like NADH-dependent reductase (Old Yellow Enzyme family)
MFLQRIIVILGEGASPIMSTLHSIETFLRRTGMPPARFGREAVRDPRLVFDLRKGREPTDRLSRRVEHFMNIYAGDASK